MKVLQVNATYGYSSTGIIMKDIGEIIRKNGGEAFFAYQTASEAPNNGYIIGNKLDWKFHALFCRLFGGQGYYSKSATNRFLQYLDEVKPDIVHLHNLHSNYIHLNLLLDYLAKKDIATVITLHDCWYFTGKCFHYVDVNCDKFQTGCGDCPKRKAAPRSLFFDVSAKVLKDRYKFLSKIPRLNIVGCSDWVCNEAKSGILRDFNITRIYNGVDIDIFKPYEKNILKENYGEDCFYVMGMANKWLLPANKDLLNSIEKILNDRLKLVLVGCKEEQISDLKQFSPNILPIGFIKDRMELAQYYSAADVFVNVTHADTLPTVNMESICCGTPVITYDSCGSPELILEGCGKVIKENAKAVLISAIHEGIEKIDKTNLTKARLRFNKHECYKSYLQCYLKILKKEE